MKAILVIAILVTAAHAEPPPAEITDDQAVALYRAHSPQLAASRAAIPVAEADRIAARIYPNPTLSVAGSSTVAGTPTSGQTLTQLGLDVPLLLYHQRARRERAADASVAAARAGVAVDQATAEHAIRVLHTELSAAQERTSVLAAAVADAEVVRGIVAGRTSAGAASPYGLERTDLAVATLVSELGDARAAEASSSQALAAAIGIPAWTPRAVDGALPPATGEHPLVAAALADRAAAEADIDRARADGKPVPSIGVQSYATTEPWGMAITGGISIPLPLFDRNQGAVAKARAEAARAVLEVDARRHELTAERERATTELAARRATLAAFDTGALAHLQKLREMAETAYRSGQGGIVELLDAVEAITEARLRHVELVHAVADAELALRAASTGD